jgi:hypothetical protein
MSRENNAIDGGCSVCHYKIMGGFSDVSSYGGSDSNESKNKMIEMIFEFVKQQNGSKDSGKILDPQSKVRYVNDYLKSVTADGKTCKLLGSIINSKIPGKVDLTKDNKQVCSDMLKLFSNFNDNLMDEHETIKNSYEEQIFNMRNVVDIMKGFISELKTRIKEGKCNFAEKSLIENNLENIERIQSGLSQIADQISSRYNDQFAQYSNKINKYIKQSELSKAFDTIKNNPDDNLNRNIINLIKILKPLMVVTYYADVALQKAGIDAKDFYSSKNSKELSALLSNKIIQNSKTLNTKEGVELLKALEILELTFPIIHKHAVPVHGGSFTETPQFFEDIELLADSIEGEKGFITTQKKLELLQQYIKNGKHIKQDTLGFNLAGLIKDVHKNLRAEVLEFVREISKQNIVIKNDENQAFVNAIVALDRELSISSETLLSIFTGMKADNRSVVDKSNINRALEEAIVSTKNLNVGNKNAKIIEVLETLNVLLNEVLRDVHSGTYKVYGGENDVIYRDDFEHFADDLKYYSNVNSLKSSLTQSEGDITKYSKNQEELNKTIFQNLLRSIDFKIEKFKSELDPNSSLSEGNQSELESYLADIRDCILNMYKVGESIDHILSEFHKKILMGNMNQGFNNLLKLIENVVSVGDWSVNDRIEAINKIFDTQDMLDFSPYLRNALKSINPSYDMSRISSVVAYNLYKESETAFGENKNLESIKLYKELTRMLYNIAVQNKVNVQYQSLIDNLLDRNFDEIIENETYKDDAVKIYLQSVFKNFREYTNTNISNIVNNGADQEPQAFNLILGGDPFSMDMILQLLMDMVTLRMPLYIGRDAVSNRPAIIAPVADIGGILIADIQKAVRSAPANVIAYNADETRARLVTLSKMAEHYLTLNNWEQLASPVNYTSDSTKLSKNMRKLSILRNMFLIFINIGETIDQQLPNDLEIGSMHSIIFQYIVTSTFVPEVNAGNLNFKIREYDSSLGNINSNIVILGGAGKFREEIDDIKNNAAFLMSGLISSLYDADDALLAAPTMVIPHGGGAAVQIGGGGSRQQGGVHLPIDNVAKLTSFFELLKVDSISNNELRFIIYGVLGLINENVVYADIQTLLKQLTVLDPVSNKHLINPNYNKLKKIMVENGAQDNDSYIIKIIGKHALNLMKFIGDVNGFVTYCKDHDNVFPQYNANNHILAPEDLDGNVNVYAVAYHNNSVRAILNLLLKSDFSGRKFIDFVEALWFDPAFLSNLVAADNLGQVREYDAFDPETKMVLMPDNDPAVQYKNPKLTIGNDVAIDGAVGALNAGNVLNWGAGVVDKATANAAHHTVGGIYDQLLQLKDAHGYDIGFNPDNLRNGNIRYDDLLDLFEYEDDENIIILGGAKTIMGGTIERSEYNASDIPSYKQHMLIKNKSTGIQYVWPANGALGANLEDSIVDNAIKNPAVYKNVEVTLAGSVITTDNKGAAVGDNYVAAYNEIETDDKTVASADILDGTKKLQAYLHHIKNKTFKLTNDNNLRKYFLASLALAGVIAFDKVGKSKGPRLTADFEKYTNVGDTPFPIRSNVDTTGALGGGLPANTKNIDSYSPSYDLYDIEDLKNARPQDATVAANNGAAIVDASTLARFNNGADGALANVDDIPRDSSIASSFANFVFATYYTNMLLADKNVSLNNSKITNNKDNKVDLFMLPTINVDGILNINAEIPLNIENDDHYILARGKYTQIGVQVKVNAGTASPSIIPKNNADLVARSNMANTMRTDSAAQQIPHYINGLYLNELPSIQVASYNNILYDGRSIIKLSKNNTLRQKSNFKNSALNLSTKEKSGNIVKLINGTSAKIFEQFYNLITNLKIDLVGGTHTAAIVNTRLGGGGAPTNSTNYGYYNTLHAAAANHNITEPASLDADLNLKDIILLNGILPNMTIRSSITPNSWTYPVSIPGVNFIKVTDLSISTYGGNGARINEIKILKGVSGLYNIINFFLLGYYLPLDNNGVLYMGNKSSGIFNFYDEGFLNKGKFVEAGKTSSYYDSQNLMDILYSMFLYNGEEAGNLNTKLPQYAIIASDFTNTEGLLYRWVISRIENTMKGLFENHPFLLSTIKLGTNVAGVGGKPPVGDPSNAAGIADLELFFAPVSADLIAHGFASANLVTDGLGGDIAGSGHDESSIICKSTYADLFMGGIDWVNLKKSYTDGHGVNHTTRLIADVSKNICDILIGKCSELYCDYYLDRTKPTFGLYEFAMGGALDKDKTVCFEYFRIKDTTILASINDPKFKLYSIASNREQTINVLKDLAYIGESQYSSVLDVINTSSNSKTTNIHTMDLSTKASKELAFDYDNSSTEIDENVNSKINGIAYVNHLVTIQELISTIKSWTAVFRHEETMKKFEGLYKFTLPVTDDLKAELHKLGGNCLTILRKTLSNNQNAGAGVGALVIKAKENLLLGAKNPYDAANPAQTVYEPYVNVDACSGRFYDLFDYKTYDEHVPYIDDSLDIFHRARFYKALLLNVKELADDSKATRDMVDKLLSDVATIDKTNEYKVRKFLVFMAVAFAPYDVMYHNILKKCRTEYELFITDPDTKESINKIYNYILKPNGVYRDCASRYVGELLYDTFKYLDTEAEGKPEKVVLPGGKSKDWYKNGVSDIANLNALLQGVLKEYQVKGYKDSEAFALSSSPVTESLLSNWEPQPSLDINNDYISEMLVDIMEGNEVPEKVAENFKVQPISNANLRPGLRDLINAETDINYLYKSIRKTQRFKSDEFDKALNNAASFVGDNAGKIVNLLKYVWLNGSVKDLEYKELEISKYFKDHDKAYKSLNNQLNNLRPIAGGNDIMGGARTDQKNGRELVSNYTLSIFNDIKIDSKVKADTARKEVLPSPMKVFGTSNDAAQVAIRNKYKTTMFDEILTSGLTIADLLPTNATTYAAARNIGVGANITKDLEALDITYIKIVPNRSIDINPAPANYDAWHNLGGGNINNLPWLAATHGELKNASVLGTLLCMSFITNNVNTRKPNKLENMLNYLNLKVNIRSGAPITWSSKCKNLRELVNMYPIPEVGNVEQLKFVVEKNGHKFLPLLAGESAYDVEYFKILNNVIKYMNAQFYNKLRVLLKSADGTGLLDLAGGALDDGGAIGVHSIQYYNDVITNITNIRHLYDNNFVLNYIVSAGAYETAGAGVNFEDVTDAHYTEGKRILDNLIQNNNLAAFKAYFTPNTAAGAAVVGHNTPIAQQHDGLMKLFKNSFANAYVPLPIFTHGGRKNASIEDPKSMYGLYLMAKYAGNPYVVYGLNFEQFHQYELDPNHGKFNLLDKVNQYSKFLSNQFKDNSARNQNHKDEINNYRKNIDKALRNKINSSTFGNVVDLLNSVGFMLSNIPIKSIKADKQLLRKYYNISLGLNEFDTSLDRIDNRFNGMLYDYKVAHREMLNIADKRLMKPFSIRSIIKAIDDGVYTYNAGDCKIDANYIRFVFMLQLSRTGYLLANSPSTVNGNYIKNFCNTFDKALSMSQASALIPSVHKYAAGYVENDGAGAPYGILAANAPLTVDKLFRNGIGSLKDIVTQKLYKHMHFYIHDLEAALIGAPLLAAHGGLDFGGDNQYPNGVAAGAHLYTPVLLNNRSHILQVAQNGVGGNVDDPLTVEPSLKHLLFAFAKQSTTNNIITGGGYSIGAVFNTLTNDDVKGVVELYELSKTINENNINDFIKAFIKFSTDSNLISIINKEQLLASLLCRHEKGNVSTPKYHIAGERGSIYSSNIVRRVYQASLNEFTASHALNDALFNTDSLFVNIIKSINARIFEALGLYDLYNRRGIYEKDSGRFLNHKTRMLIGAGNEDVNPLIADLYIRLPLLGLFYKDLFEKSGVANYKFGVVPDNTGLYGPFIEFMFIKLDDKVKSLKHFTNDDVYNVVILCNNIYNSVKHVDNIYKDFVAEINRRYGYMNSRMYDSIKEELRENIKTRSHPELSRDVVNPEFKASKVKLPGEGKIPTYSTRNYNKLYDLFNFSDKEKVNISNIKDTIENFRRTLDRKLTEQIETSTFKLTPFINNFKSNLVNAKGDKIGDLKEFYNKIDHYTEKALSPTEVLFTEFVRSGIELIEHNMMAIHNLFVNSFSIVNFRNRVFNPKEIEDGPVGIIYREMARIFINEIMTSTQLAAADYRTDLNAILGDRFDRIFTGDKVNKIVSFKAKLNAISTVYEGPNYGTIDAKRIAVNGIKQALNEELIKIDEMPLFLYGNQFIPYDKVSTIQLDFRVLKNKIKEMLDYIVVMKGKFYNTIDTDALTFYDLKITKLIKNFNELFNDDIEDSLVKKLNENLGLFNLNKHLTSGAFIIHKSLPYNVVGKIININNAGINEVNVSSRIMITNFNDLTMLTPIQMFNTLLCGLLNNFGDLNGNYYYKGLIEAMRSQEINDAIASPEGSTIGDELDDPDQIFSNKNIVARSIIDRLNGLINPNKSNAFKSSDRPNMNNFLLVLDNISNISEVTKNKMSSMLPSYIALFATLINNTSKVIDLINANYSNLEDNKKSLADTILVINNKIVKSARFTSDRLALLYKELGSQVNTYMEPYDGFNEEYEQRFHQPHIAPITFMLYSNGYTSKVVNGRRYETTLDNIDKVFPINNKVKNYKFLNAMKIIFSDNLPNINLFTWDKLMITKFNESNQSNQIHDDEMLAYIRVFVDLCKNDYSMITSALIQGRNNLAFQTREDRNPAGNYVDRIKASLDIDQMLTVLENDDASGYERLKELFRFSFKKTPEKMNFENQSIVANLVELGIPPINLNEMMKEIPLATMFNAVYNFDKFIERNVDYVLKDKYSEDFIQDFKLYLKNPLMYDKEEASKFNDLSLGEMQAKLFVDSTPTSSLSVTLNYIYNIYKLTIISIQQKMRQRIAEKNRTLKGAEVFL